ncbi:hypothetical protein [Nocardia aurea]|uniref:Uncharacterized protein n=1 Tax=Nocardia aurea TaxID=2144174 RepID=A0ABV3G4W9_9NOCA
MSLQFRGDDRLYPRESMQGIRTAISTAQSTRSGFISSIRPFLLSEVVLRAVRGRCFEMHCRSIAGHCWTSGWLSVSGAGFVCTLELGHSRGFCEKRIRRTVLTVLVLSSPPDLAAALTDDGFDLHDGNLRGGEIVDVVVWTVEHRETITNAVAETVSVVVASAHVVNAVAVVRKWVQKRRQTTASPAAEVYFVDREGRRVPVEEWLAELPDDAAFAARIEQVLRERRAELPPSQG